MAQIEGAGLFALSVALYEELKFENGAFYTLTNTRC